MDPQQVLGLAKAIQSEVSGDRPPEEGRRAQAEAVIPRSIVRGTRGYLESVSNQINGAYENGWYDACSVMIRRLLETLIIESYEHHQMADRIKNSLGDFLFLRDLVDKAVGEPAWNLTRGSKLAMPKLKDIGDKSAHSRRYIAHRSDVEPLLPNIRMVVQELVFLAGLK